MLHPLQNNAANYQPRPPVTSMFNKLQGQPPSYDKKFVNLYHIRVLNGTAYVPYNY